MRPFSPLPRSTDSLGLCATCLYRKDIRSDRGSLFHQCALSFVDQNFAKYPHLPVLQCSGWKHAREAAPQETIP